MIKKKMWKKMQGFVEEGNVENDGAHKKLKGGATESDGALAEAAAQERWDSDEFE